jgi:hypothetical protein
MGGGLMRIEYFQRKVQEGEKEIVKLEASEIIGKEFLSSDDWQGFINDGLSVELLREIVRRNSSELLSAAAALKIVRAELAVEGLAAVIGEPKESLPA